MSATQQGPLARQLLDASVFPQLLEDSKALVASEVEKKNMALRTGFNMVRKAKPNLIDSAMRTLLPEFVEALEPFYADAQADTGPDPETRFRDHLMAHQTEVADALLAVSDRRVADVDNRVVKSGYQRLRGRAQREVVTAMPGIAGVMSKYAD
ncbi:DUF6918 family protein [Salinisphaera sp.]|uniref:DUF6918 family protein n=1 Tax=Salinisphaera sp. TaxID=1914330 RepID=UPI002D78D6CF|nr:hypothetical protein [Salinisphaera sp.]HET7315346.1 hypothetical protein [Salinisphaera sp.]